MKIILSTRNPSKAEQIKALFNGSAILIQTLDEAGIRGEAVEDGNTLAENALKKSLYVHEMLPEKHWAMADDTGLFINALNGEPGVRSARWAGENIQTEELLEYCLKRLDGASDRSAMFETTVSLISPEGEQYFFTGRIGGNLLSVPRVKPQPKMPYSCLFVPNGTDKSWAEMTTEEENAISHRGQAFRQVVKFFESTNKH